MTVKYRIELMIVPYLSIAVEQLFGCEKKIPVIREENDESFSEGCSISTIADRDGDRPLNVA